MENTKNYINEINQWLLNRYENNKLKYLIELEGFENVRDSNIFLKDIYYKEVETSIESKEEDTYVSVTHMFVFNGEEIPLERLLFGLNTPFHLDMNKIMLSEDFFTEIEPLRIEEISIDKHNNILLLEEILGDLNFTESTWDTFKKYENEIQRECFNRDVISMDDANLLFPNIISVEGISLEETKLYINKDISFTFQNDELKKALLKIKK